MTARDSSAVTLAYARADARRIMSEHTECAKVIGERNRRIAELEHELSIQDAANDILTRDLADWKRMRNEAMAQATFNRNGIDALAAELAAVRAEFTECNRIDARVQADQRTRIARLEAALTLLTNGFKYSTEVVTIAREALGGRRDEAR